MYYRTVNCHAVGQALAYGFSLPISPVLTGQIIDDTETALVRLAHNLSR